MISKTSLFNKGIYKSTLRRFMWGGLLYGVLLFIASGMMILIAEPKPYYSAIDYPVILSSSYMVLPMLLSIAVPSVAGVMLFRFIHSKVNSVFVHSLPVRKSANYISSVLAGLTLMILPIVLNGLVLMLISFGTSYDIYAMGDVCIWILINIFSVFTMFSAVCFVASITGNSFAMIGLNILFHTIGLILAASFIETADTFIYGFSGNNELLNAIVEKSFIPRVPQIMLEWSHRAEYGYSFLSDIIIFLISAIALYVLAGFLYTKRRLETAEDVAGFKCLNAIFKYLVTFVGAMATFALYGFSLKENPILIWSLVALVSMVIYFVLEAFLKKTLRVWKSYKGYLVFVLCYGAIMLVMSQTSFFGFETYVPSEQDVQSVAFYQWYNEEKPDVSDEEVIKEVINFHRERLTKKVVINDYDRHIKVQLEYKLKNEKTISRAYFVTEEELNEIMGKLYKNINYKKKAEGIFDPIDEIYEVTLWPVYDETIYVSGEDKQRELINCLRKDTEELSYSELQLEDTSFGVNISYIKKTLPATRDDNLYIQEPYRMWIGADCNMNYTNTITWLKANDYWDKIIIDSKEAK